ncbi:hypothetical protein N8I77_000412 [Diaporthe amygdali]|uniref:Uncharacterized protein n=1 Tax=Phomopsis amygdali TaxID=1214568 RepID=A0AAD9W757_PHOAM|nr:hypothetical protein N8I77_000412 [Diaporthe amygdali]
MIRPTDTESRSLTARPAINTAKAAVTRLSTSPVEEAISAATPIVLSRFAMVTKSARGSDLSMIPISWENLVVIEPMSVPVNSESGARTTASSRTWCNRMPVLEATKSIPNIATRPKLTTPRICSAVKTPR